MSNHCKIEFYFRREDMEKLLKESNGAKGIVIRQEIKPRKNADGKGFTNVTTISAYAKGKTAGTADIVPDKRQIYGCPNPPGCDSDPDPSVVSE